MNFLKLNDPKAAVAVASAGAIVLTITTTICNSFNLPGSYVALALSALMATTLVPNLKKNIVNYLFMSLVIFHLAKGGNLTMSAAEDALLPKALKAETLTAMAPQENLEALVPLAPITTFPEPIEVYAPQASIEPARETEYLDRYVIPEAGSVAIPEAIPEIIPTIDEPAFSPAEAVISSTNAMATEYVAEKADDEGEGNKKIFRAW